MFGVSEIHEPATVEEASEMLAEYEYDASVYAGGTELLILMKQGLVRYPHLINIKTIPDLDDISVDENAGQLSIGTLVTHYRLERSRMVKQYAPLLAEVESMIANVRVRAAGTIGGNLCFGEPHSDPATLLLAWGASLELGSSRGRRTVPAEDFFIGLFATAREDDELLTRVTVPLLPTNVAGAYEKFSVHERPTTTAAAFVGTDESGIIEEARLAIGSVGPAPARVAGAEEVLRGERPSEDLFAAAADEAAQAADPVNDHYGSVEYKRHLVRVLTARALNNAAARSKETNA